MAKHKDLSVKEKQEMLKRYLHVKMQPMRSFVKTEDFSNCFIQLEIKRCHFSWNQKEYFVSNVGTKMWR